MLFMIVNAVISALFFFLIVLPCMYIYDPDKHPGESVGPPSAGEVISEDSVSHSVQQKLYMLFTIPLFSILNWLFLYFSYYRHIRYVQYRVEVNVMSLYEKRSRAEKELQSTGIEAFQREKSHSTINFTVDNNPNTSIFPRAAPPKGDGDAAAQPFSWQDRETLIQCARPKDIKREVYVTSSFFPEIRDLFREVENGFFTPAIIAEKNFLQAVARLLGEPASSPPAKPTIAPPHWSNRDDGFYASKRPPAAGHRGSGGGSGQPAFMGRTAGEPTAGEGGSAASRRRKPLLGAGRTRSSWSWLTTRTRARSPIGYTRRLNKPPHSYIQCGHYFLLSLLRVWISGRTFFFLLVIAFFKTIIPLNLPAETTYNCAAICWR